MQGTRKVEATTPHDAAVARLGLRDRNGTLLTIFDSLFLPQGVVLHRTLERHAGSYSLWILCVDDAAHAILEKLSLPNTRLLRLSELETDALRRVKAERTTGEYCWTLTPFAPWFVLNADPEVPRVTYVDADFWFRKSPDALFIELDRSGKDILITDHAYAPENDGSADHGRFCVQFVVFTRTRSDNVIREWQGQCLEWCFNRTEPNRFGDQKYLDTWPLRFPQQVHVLENKELILGPWNVTRFPYGNAVAFHFWELRLLPNRRVRLTPLVPVPQLVIDTVYADGLKDLRSAISLLESVGWAYRAQASPLSLYTRTKRLRRLLIEWLGKYRLSRSVPLM